MKALTFLAFCVFCIITNTATAATPEPKYIHVEGNRVRVDCPKEGGIVTTYDQLGNVKTQYVCEPDTGKVVLSSERHIYGSVGIGPHFVWTGIGPSRAPEIMGEVAFLIGNTPFEWLIQPSFAYWDGVTTVSLATGLGMNIGPTRLGLLGESLVMGDGDSDDVASLGGRFDLQVHLLDIDEGVSLRLAFQAGIQAEVYVDDEGDTHNDGVLKRLWVGALVRF